jgi:hypothetical protein
MVLDIVRRRFVVESIVSVGSVVAVMWGYPISEAGDEPSDIQVKRNYALLDKTTEKQEHKVTTLRFEFTKHNSRSRLGCSMKFRSDYSVRWLQMATPQVQHRR